MYCKKCDVMYYSINILTDQWIEYFVLYIDNYVIFYYPNRNVCEVFSNDNYHHATMEDIPLDKFLLLIPILKEKINNLIGYL